MVRIFSRWVNSSCGMPFSYASEAIVLASRLASLSRCLGGRYATIASQFHSCRQGRLAIPVCKSSTASTRLLLVPLPGGVSAMNKNFEYFIWSNGINLLVSTSMSIISDSNSRLVCLDDSGIAWGFGCRLFARSFRRVFTLHIG